MGDSRFDCCLQGGGVYVGEGTVSIVNSQIYSNTAFEDVRFIFKKSQHRRPDGRLTF
jgi:hypothetical protein